MVKIINNKNLHDLTDTAKNVVRLRAHLNVHDSLDASVQRLFIATEPDTYMRPHRHPQKHKWEFFILIEGEIDLLIFDDNGHLIQRTKMSETGTRAVEIPPNTWHAYVCQKTSTLALEVKEGAYIPTPEEDFAPWSPAEGAAEVADY